MHESAIWLERVTNKSRLRDALKLAKTRLQAAGVEFDTIVFTGVSGGLFAPVLAYSMKKEIVVVRKEGADSHSNYKCEGFKSAKRYLFVDDIIASGATLKHVRDRMEKYAPQAVFVGVYMYAEGAGNSGSPKGFADASELGRY